MTATTITPGTRVRVKPGALPSGSEPDTVTVLDPTGYTRNDGPVVPPTLDTLLIPNPHGWEVQDKTSGQTSRVWWVASHRVEVIGGQVETPDPTDLTPAEQARVDNIVAASTVDQQRTLLTALIREGKAQHHAAAEQRDALAADLDRVRREARDEVDALNRQNVQARDERDAARRDLAAFRTQVRDVAIRVAEEEGWCTPGLNEVLEELGLDRKQTTYRVEVEVTARQRVTVVLDADDEDDAQRRIVDGDVDLNDRLESHGWDWQTADDLEFLEIKTA